MAQVMDPVLTPEQIKEQEAFAKKYGATGKPAAPKAPPPAPMTPEEAREQGLLGRALRGRLNRENL